MQRRQSTSRPTPKLAPLNTNLTLMQQGLLLVGVPLLFELAIVGLLAYLLHQVEIERHREAKVTNCERLIEQIPESLSRAADYLVSGVCYKSDRLLESYRTVESKVPAQLIELKQSLQDEPGLRQTIDPNALESLEKEVDQAIDLMHRIASQQEKPPEDGDLPLMKLLKVAQIGSNISNHNVALISAVSSTIKTSPQIQAHYRHLIWIAICAGSIINTLVAIVMARVFSAGAAHRLAVLLENMENLRAGKMLKPPIEGRDEIARLDTALREMARSLHLAAQRERAANATAVRIIETIPVSLLIVADDGLIELANPAAQRMFRCGADQIQGRSIGDILPAPGEGTGIFLQHLKENQNRLIQRETVRQDREQLCTMLFVTTIATNDGARLLLILHDITERWEVEKLRRQFVSMVSHDLRAPLTSVLGSIELLSTGSLGTISDTAKNCAIRAEAEVGRLIVLVGDLLDLARIDAGRMPLHLATKQLDAIIQRSIASVRSLSEAASVSIEYSESKVQVNADSDRLVQVMINLLSNAIKFSPAQATVRVTVEELPDRIVVRVSDQGPGIEKSQQESIFERFIRRPGSAARGEAGSGLGLPICKSIIQQHNGTMGVSSESGSGSTFWFELPLPNQEEKLAPTRQSAQSPSTVPLTPIATKPESSQRQFSLSLWQKGLVLVLVPLIFELAPVACLGLLLHQSEVNLQKLDIARNYRQCIFSVITTTFDAGRSVSVYNVLHSPRALERYRKDVVELRAMTAQLVALSQQGQFNQELTKTFETGVIKGISSMDNSIQADRPFNMPTPVGMRSLKENLEAQLAVAAQIDRAEHSLIEQSGAQIDQSIWMALYVGLGANVVLAVLLAIYFSRGTANRLNCVVANTQRLSQNKMLAKPLSGNDEIAQLDRFFHVMARDLRLAAEKERLINERIRLTVENLPAALFVVDAHGVIELVNSAALRMFAISNSGEALNKHLSDVVYSADQQSAANFQEFIDRVQEGETIQLDLRGVNAKAFSCELSTVHLDAFAGPRLMVIVSDVTERRELERLKQELIDTVYNNLSTPLGSVHLSLDSLSSGAMGKLPDEAHRLVVIAASEIERLSRLVDELLDWAKIEAGKLTLQIARVPLDSVIKRSIAALKHSSEVKQISIESNAATTALDADGDRLVQVLVNLLSNAIKFSPKGATIAVAANPLPGGVVEIRVSDRGRGVPESQREAIFEEFHQVQATDATVRGGTGLGLPICKRIITAHGGTIGVRDNEEQGSIFWFTLPLTREAS